MRWWACFLTLQQVGLYLLSPRQYSLEFNIGRSDKHSLKMCYAFRLPPPPPPGQALVFPMAKLDLWQRKKIIAKVWETISLNYCEMSLKSWKSFEELYCLWSPSKRFPAFSEAATNGRADSIEIAVGWKDQHRVDPQWAENQNIRS